MVGSEAECVCLTHGRVARLEGLDFTNGKSGGGEDEVSPRSHVFEGHSGLFVSRFGLEMSRLSIEEALELCCDCSFLQDCYHINKAR